MSLNRLNKEFDSSEHKSLGNVKLPGLSAEFNKFAFQPGGAELTFGEIIALAGDYFGVEQEPIALGETEEERRKRFLDAYATLANCPSEKVYALTNIFVNEEAAAKEAISEGVDETVGMDKITPEETKIALKSTDGHYLTLALHNLDHFNKFAQIAYDTGYTLAMEAAVEAANLEDTTAQQKKLEYAYTLYAFGCHFMTDLFAAGHMRTPTAELREKFGAEIGSTLTFLQHNEDGDLGLVVEGGNINDDTVSQWMAYGDGHLFEKKSLENQSRALNTVQLGVNELYQAFETKQAKPAHESGVKKLIPNPLSKNHPPMFKVNDGKLLCRVPLEGEPVDQYEKLNHLKAYEILAIHAKKMAHTAIVDKINECKLQVEKKLKEKEENLKKQATAEQQTNQNKPIKQDEIVTQEELVKQEVQKNKIYEIDFESLNSHSMFSNSELRKRGVPNQSNSRSLSESDDSNVSFELAEDEEKKRGICPIKCNIF